MKRNPAGDMIEKWWHELDHKYPPVFLHDHIVMPNHFHGIIIIEQLNENVGATRRVARNNEERAIQRIAPTKKTLISNSLGSIIGQFKSRVTKKLHELSGDQELKIWQRNYYEHIIRNDLDLYNIRKYIEDNPLKWEIDEYYNV